MTSIVAGCDVARIVIRRWRVYVFSTEKHSQTYFHALRYKSNGPPTAKAIATLPADMASHCRCQPPSQQRRQSRASSARFCPLNFCRGGGGGADNNNDSTPSSTSTRSSSAAVAAEGDPMQRPWWQQRHHRWQQIESTINKQC